MTTAQGPSLHLGTFLYQVKGYKSCLRVDANEPQSQQSKAKTIVGRSGQSHRVSGILAFLVSVLAHMLYNAELIFRLFAKFSPYGIFIWNILIKYSVFSVWITLCVHAKGCVWITNI